MEGTNNSRIPVASNSYRPATHGSNIVDARSESRKEFTKIKLTDPREKLSQLPIKQANERRHKRIADTRAKSIEAKDDITENEDTKTLSLMIKELSRILSNFMETTNKEIENIKKIIDLNHNIQLEEHKEIAKLKEKIERNWEHKTEYTQRNYDQDSQSDKVINKNYENFKQNIKQEAKKQLQAAKPFYKAILYDRYYYNKARIVTKSEDTIKVYNISISYRYGNKIYFIKIQNRWEKINAYIIDRLRSEGLIYGFKNVINTLRQRRKYSYTSKKNSEQPHQH